MLPAVTALASSQSKPTRAVMDAANRLLAYAAAHPNHQLVYSASDMILYGQSDASYLSRSGARSVAGGLWYLGNTRSPTHINGAVTAMSSIIPVVVASVGEAEYAGLFMNAQTGEWLRSVCRAVGKPQPPTLIMCDNQCAVGIATDTVKLKRTKTIDMRFHWVRDRVNQGHFIIMWRKGQHNLADFFTKALPVHVHRTHMPFLVRNPPSAAGTRHCPKNLRLATSKYSARV